MSKNWADNIEANFINSPSSFAMRRQGYKKRFKTPPAAPPGCTLDSDRAVNDSYYFDRLNRESELANYFAIGHMQVSGK
jgi:hypothetical protein